MAVLSLSQLPFLPSQPGSDMLLHFPSNIKRDCVIREKLLAMKWTTELARTNISEKASGLLATFFAVLMVAGCEPRLDL